MEVLTQIKITTMVVGQNNHVKALIWLSNHVSWLLQQDFTRNDTQRPFTCLKQAGNHPACLLTLYRIHQEQESIESITV